MSGKMGDKKQVVLAESVLPSDQRSNLGRTIQVLYVDPTNHNSPYRVDHLATSLTKIRFGNLLKLHLK